MRLLHLLIAAAFSTSAIAADVADKPRLHDSATLFAQVWEANQDKPAAQQVAAFKAQVAPAFPGFYKADRFKGLYTPEQYDGVIDTALKEFPAMRAAYAKKAQQFSAELPAYVASFRKVFTDFEPPEDIYVLHSLGEMDGGMRKIDGKTVAIFGIDSMVKYHGDMDETAFFHHELFHFHHSRVAEDCGNAGIWSNLWAEGLAVYASKVLNPQADDKAMLLEIPNNMAARTRAALPEAFAHLEGVLDKNDDATFASLFLRRGETPTLPGRRGYYLGYLVAQEAGKTHDIRDMAKMKCSQARELVFLTVHTLRERLR